MTKFSANLGFLFTELDLPQAIHAAKAAGFDAVECHFPYETPPEQMKAALGETGLRMLGLNTWPGNREAGDFGLAALPDRIPEARAEIARAVEYAAAAGVDAVHVMAGRTDSGTAAEDCFRSNLNHACDLAAKHGINVLIEPINTRDVAGYHLSTTDHAERIVDALARPNLKIMFDCYHMQIMQGDLAKNLERLLPKIGHIQIAAVPDRAEPDHGEVDYRWLLAHIAALGYQGIIGAEYHPKDTTTGGLGWMDDLKNDRC
ncbi:MULTISPECIES: TIM barrel protein [Rhodobacterales]|uniref:hydroxypyruvate isomerase family protein n=1 Tax=Roseobacter sp. N2S TaxID=2663844 RepID=UPI002854E5AC|nr:MULTISPECIES: TIM barrel protein [Rhodobacterales]MDR6266967.1 hydroxypyruvate isomerase [Roseobacter sp. N2S]